MVSAIPSLTAVSAAQLSNPASASSPSPAKSRSNEQLAPDTVSISSAAQKASATGDVDHDGDSH